VLGGLPPEVTSRDQAGIEAIGDLLSNGYCRVRGKATSTRAATPARATTRDRLGERDLIAHVGPSLTARMAQL
jgi:hypothetical protein